MRDKQKISRALPDPLLAQFSDFLARRIGLHFPEERWHDLERAINSAAREFEFRDVTACIQWLLSSTLTRHQVEVLATHFAIGETYFFREKESFERLERHILPDLIRARSDGERRLRIWSAGCCTGEEAYSIAILLYELLPDYEDWHITILATDIMPGFLRKATQGIYKEWSFRDTPAVFKDRYFRRTGGKQFVILPRIKGMVAFDHLNLADDVYPSVENNTNAMDVILCRNVLMYFEPECAARVAQKFHAALVDGGWLIVSPTETSQVLFRQFVTVSYPGVTIYRKDGSPLPADKAATASAAAPAGEPSAWLEPISEPIPEPAHLQASEQAQAARAEEQIPVPRQQSTYEQALGLYQHGRYSEASIKIGEVLSRDPSDVRGMAFLARLCAGQGKLAESVEWCRKAVGADKLNPDWWYLLAAVLQEQDQIDEAAAALSRALYLDPRFALAHFAMGNVARRQGKRNEAQRHFRNALALLRAYPTEEILPASEGMTAGRLTEIIQSTISSEAMT